MSLMNEQRVWIHTGLCPALCKLGKVQVPTLVPILSTFSLAGHHLLPFQSITWAVKSPFIAQAGCGLRASRLRQRTRCMAIFSPAQSTEFIRKKISYDLSAKWVRFAQSPQTKTLLQLFNLLFPQGRNEEKKSILTSLKNKKKKWQYEAGQKNVLSLEIRLYKIDRNVGKELNMKILVKYENTLSNVIFTTEKT